MQILEKQLEDFLKTISSIVIISYLVTFKEKLCAYFSISFIRTEVIQYKENLKYFPFIKFY